MTESLSAQLEIHLFITSDSVMRPQAAKEQGCVSLIFGFTARFQSLSRVQASGPSPIKSEGWLISRMKSQPISLDSL